MKNSHPPIPPNCPYFWKGHFCCSGFMQSLKRKRSKYSDQLFLERSVVASVARCAWLDEAFKRMSLVSGMHGHEIQNRSLEVEQALANASLWKTWGEQK